MSGMRVIPYIARFDRNIWVLAVGWFVSALGFSVSLPFVSIYFHAELDVSLSGIGLFFGAMALVRALFQIVGGELCDRMDRRRLLIGSQLARGALFVFITVAVHQGRGLGPIAGGLLLSSAFGALFQPVASALVADLLPPSDHMDGYAITRAGMNVGWAAGPALGGFLVAYAYDLLFAISAGITLFSAAVYALFLHAPAPQRGGDRRFRLADVLAVRTDARMAWHCGLSLCLFMVVSQLAATLSVYAVEMVGLPARQLGWLYTSNGVLVALLQIPVTHRLNRFRATRLMAAGGLLYFCGYAAMGVCTVFWMFLLAMLVVTLGEVTMSPSALTITARLAPPGQSGRYMGIFGFFSTGGWSLGPLWGGFVLGHLGAQPLMAWTVIASLGLVAALGYLWIEERL